MGRRLRGSRRMRQPSTWRRKLAARRLEGPEAVGSDAFQPSVFSIPVFSLRLWFVGQICVLDDPPSSTRFRLFGLRQGRHPPFDLALHHPSDPGADGHAIPLSDGLGPFNGLRAETDRDMAGQQPRLPRPGTRADRAPILLAAVCHGLFTHSRWRSRSSLVAPSRPMGRHILGLGLLGGARATLRTIPLLDEDDKPLGPRIEGVINAGHPPRTKRGTPTFHPLAVAFNMVPFPHEGGYRFRVTSGDSALASVPFRVRTAT